MKNAFSCFASSFKPPSILCTSPKLHYDKLNYINNMEAYIKFIGFYGFTSPKIASYPNLSAVFQTTQQADIDKITQRK